ncbi:MAG: LLM class F420-dependent oxidoreductase, partial [Candidatus Rokuibacteriota bacterium]
FRLEGATMAPKPVQTPHPPLWIGGHHPNALRRAVTLGAGFMGAGSASTAAFVEQTRQVARFCEEAGRDPATLDVGKRVYIAVDRDRDRAGRRLAEWFGLFYGRPELAAEVAVWGSSDECLEGLRAVVGAGARLLMLNPVFDELAHLESFGELAPRV